VRAALLMGLLASSLALTGCTQGDPGDDFGEPTCPSWTKGRSSMIVSPATKLYYSNQTQVPDFFDWDYAEESYNANGTLQTRWSAFGSSFKSLSGKPLDFLVFDFHGAEFTGGRSFLLVEDAEVTLQFFAESADGSPEGQPMAAWDVDQGKESAKTEWTFRSDPKTGYALHNVTLRVDLAQPNEAPNPRGVFAYWTWTFDLDGDRDTPSGVTTAYAPEFWYRTCWSDGTPATVQA
jgi:hypothetical protein